MRQIERNLAFNQGILLPVKISGANSIVLALCLESQGISADLGLDEALQVHLI